MRRTALARIGRQALMTGTLLLTLTVAVSACKTSDALPELGVIPAFALSDQNGHAFAETAFDGKVTVVSFFFTRCPTICPLLVQRGLSLQSRVAPFGGRVRQVSFSVDPEHDTPDVLRAYGAGRGIDFNRWSLVTGKIDVLSRVVVHGFREAMGEPSDDGKYDIMHSAHFVLIDAQRRIRGYYEVTPEGMDKLVADVQRLLRSNPVPIR